jgi:CubicO group peptidase (beta-lactamase class C family)
MSALQLYSMTKLITSIACIQLWERGLVDFDDAALIEKHLPELVTQPILKEYNDDTAVFTPRTRPLTLRHLLTHTSGLGSGMLSPLLGRWEAEHGGAKSFAPGATAADLAQPILFEPGTKYAYGIGLDWAGVLVERVSGSTLEDYFQTHIFAPIGLTKEDMTFLPTDSVQERLMEVLGRQPDGGLAPADGLRKVPGLKPQDVTLYLGGAGLLGTARAYMTVLREVLACGKRDGVLSRKGYDLVFANALPARSEQSSQQIYEDLAAMMVFSGLSEEQYTNPDGAGNAHSLALCLTELDSVHGRKKGTASWSGAAKTRFWIDPVSGVAVSLNPTLSTG